MGSSAIIAAIDTELIRLQKIRATIIKKGNSAKPAPTPGGSAATKKKNHRPTKSRGARPDRGGAAKTLGRGAEREE